MAQMQVDNPDIDTTPRADEELVEAQGNIRVAKLRAGGPLGAGRRLTHPSGVEVIETTEDLAKRRAEIVADIAEKQAELAAFDADRTIATG